MLGLGLGMELEFSDLVKRTCFNLKGDLKTKNSSTHEVRKGENKKKQKTHTATQLPSSSLCEVVGR